MLPQFRLADDEDDYPTAGGLEKVGLKTTGSTEISSGTDLGRSPEARLAAAMGSLYSEMEAAVEPVTPLAVLVNLRLAAPQFAELDVTGRYSQQGTKINASTG